jgi:multicomponent K+:H+ antiporter subunit D
VFAVKAALLPLYFWLPNTYGAASAPVAALFSIMTKVGIYAVLRVTTLIFGDSGGPATQVAAPALEVLALATLVLGAVGALAAQQLRTLVGQVVVASAGTLLLSIALARVDTVAAGLFYLVNSTLVAAALFLLADRVRAARAGAGVPAANDMSSDALRPLSIGPGRLALGSAFFVLAMAAAGLPPLAGFLGKAMLLQAAGLTPHAPWIVGLVLASSLLTMVAFARSGSSLFWKSALDAPVPSSSNLPAQSLHPDAACPWHTVHGASLWLLGLLILACAVLAGPLSRYTLATANQLFERETYINAVLRTHPEPAALDVRREMRERQMRERQMHEREVRERQNAVEVTP